MYIYFRTVVLIVIILVSLFFFVIPGISSILMYNKSVTAKVFNVEKSCIHVYYKLGTKYVWGITRIRNEIINNFDDIKINVSNRDITRGRTDKSLRAYRLSCLIVIIVGILNIIQSTYMLDTKLWIL